MGMNLGNWTGVASSGNSMETTGQSLAKGLDPESGAGPICLSTVLGQRVSRKEPWAR